MDLYNSRADCFVNLDLETVQRTFLHVRSYWKSALISRLCDILERLGFRTSVKLTASKVLYAPSVHTSTTTCFTI